MYCKLNVDKYSVTFWMKVSEDKGGRRLIETIVETIVGNIADKSLNSASKKIHEVAKSVEKKKMLTKARKKAMENI